MFFFAKLLHAKPKHASGEVGSREKRERKPEKKKKVVSVIITSWFAIALDEIRTLTRRILREKADCKQSRSKLSVQNDCFLINRSHTEPFTL